MTPSRGRFVVVEGIDGCGKTTQLQALMQWLPGSGLMPPGADLIQTREPGGTALGQALRQLLLHPLKRRLLVQWLNCCCMPPIGPSMWNG